MNETQELLLNLIEYTKTGEHTKFEQLRFVREYITARTTYKAMTKVIVVLEGSATNLFKEYCKMIKQQEADLNLLFAYKQLLQAINFYKDELVIIKDILKDYEKYFWKGDFLADLISGKERDIWNQH